MGEDTREAKDNPNVIYPPPLIYGGALVVGLLANYLYPFRFVPHGATKMLGWTLFGGGLVLGRFGVRALRDAGTNVDPYKPVNTFVYTGPYRFTRNPLYLGLTLMYAGIAIRVNALWPALLLPLVLRVMQRGVIEREEHYLEQKFGEEYIRYKERVRRWI